MSLSGQPFFALDPRWWPAIVESLTGSGDPWPEEAMLADLRWWEDQIAVGREQRIPGRRALAARWNVNPNSRAVRSLLKRMGFSGTGTTTSNTPVNWNNITPVTGPGVYFIRVGDLPNVKIGMSNDISSRLSGLQTGCPELIRVLGVVETADAGEASRLEAIGHYLVSRWRRHGEWFEITDLMVSVARMTLERIRDGLEPEMVEEWEGLCGAEGGEE